MIVIQHVPTGERMMYPLTNTNILTDPIRLEQYIPHDFKISLDQTPVPLFHPVYNTVNWEATTQDPINQYKIWNYLNGAR